MRARVRLFAASVSFSKDSLLRHDRKGKMSFAVFLGYVWFGNGIVGPLIRQLPQ